MIINLRLKASPKLWRSSLFLRDINHHKRFHSELFTFYSRKQNKVPQTSSLSCLKCMCKQGLFIVQKKNKQPSFLANWPVTLTLGCDLSIRGFKGPNPTTNSQDTRGCLAFCGGTEASVFLRGVTLLGLLYQAIVRRVAGKEGQ